MKTRKTVIAVLTAVLLISAALMVGCMNPAEELSAKQGAEDSNYQVPAGKGIVRFKIADSDARTILPDFTEYFASDSNVGAMFFDVKFTDTSSAVTYFPAGVGGNPPAKKATYAQVTAPITLANGSYSFIITAFNDDDGTIPIAGYTSVSNITVTGGATSTAGPFKLLPLIGTAYDGTNTYNGRFTYDVTIPSQGYDTKTLAIYTYANQTTPIDTISLVEDTKTTATKSDIPSGYYIIKVTVAKNHYLTRQYTEALHVYAGMHSKMTALTVPELVQNEFEVSFNMSSRPISNGSNAAFNPQYIQYAKQATKPAVNPAANDTDYVFKGWYDGSGGTGDEWDFATWILADRVLYAKWAQAAGFEIELEEDVELMNAPTITVGTSLVRSTLEGDGSITIKLAAPIGGSTWTAGSIVWSINDEIDAAAGLDSNHTDTLIITNGGNFLPLLAGTTNTSFIVSVTATSGGKPYSAKIEVSVTGTPTQP
jgi:uncharacterized repeat protein (TIGR02543 family)